MDDTTLLWLKLSMVSGFGWRLAQKIKAILPLQNLFTLSIQELQSYLPLTRYQLKLIQQTPDRRINNEIEECKKNQIDIIHIDSPNYPALLKEIASPPLILYIKGKKSILNSLSISIVGSRKPTIYGKKMHIASHIVWLMLTGA